MRYVTMKEEALATEPPAVNTLIRPVVALAGTVAEILVELTTVNTADLPLNATRVAPVNPDPRMVTMVPTDPDVGENLSILGRTLKDVELAAVPPDVLTVIGPVVAPAGTRTRIWVSEFTWNCAPVPLNATVMAPVNRVPVMVTTCFTVPAAGVKLAMVGACDVLS
jgi:hypothetical protein